MSGPPPPFRIRRLTPAEVARPAARPEPAHAQAAPPAAAATADTNAVFENAQAALAFLGQVAGAGLTDTASASRGPRGRWRIAVAVPHAIAAPLAAAVGGQIFAPDAAVKVAGAEAWQPATLGQLVTSVALRPAAAQLEIAEAVVVTGARLGQVILRRAAAAGLAVDLIPSVRQPIAGGAATPAVTLRLRWRGGRPPRTLLTALARLPDTLVARPVGATPADPAEAVQGLLVDIRYQPPPAAALIVGLIAADEGWLLGGPDVGNWRIEPRGPAMDGLTLLAPARLPAVLPPVTAASTALPAAVPIALSLVADPAAAGGAPDAVLLEDDELAWTRRFLMARPAAAEGAFLLPGPGRHLLIAPGGLLERVPFGIALRRSGLEPLLIEQGQRFYPLVPAAARASLFGAGAEELVVVVRARPGALFVARYALSAPRPVWQLWLAEPPPVAAGITGAAAQRLQALAARIDRDRPKAEPDRRPPILRRLLHRSDSRETLLRRALALEREGRLAAAAEVLEQAGETLRAARLYEKAAGELA